MRTLLIVDDNMVNRKLAAAMLKKRGWIIEEVEDGASALDRLSNGGIDYVLLDISMPGMTGEDVCRFIRQNESTRDLHVVAYTAHAMDSEKQRIMSAGFNDIVIKPVSVEELNSKFPD